jgi:hypothetical protein
MVYVGKFLLQVPDAEQKDSAPIFAQIPVHPFEPVYPSEILPMQ